MECRVLFSSLGQDRLVFPWMESDRDCDFSPCTAIDEPAEGKFSGVIMCLINGLRECSIWKLRS
jgi:hypothetical protein